MEEKTNWICSVLIFSGLKNPEWEISACVAEKLVSLINAGAEPVSKEFGDESGAYNGCVMKSPEGVYLRIFNGLVQINEAGRLSFFADENRKFERGILLTAPAKVLAGINIDF